VERFGWGRKSTATYGTGRTRRRTREVTPTYSLPNTLHPF
jgi:hypothetical protein